MAVESTNISVVYTVTSAASGQEFPIPFPYIEKEHVIAYYSDNGDVTNLTYGTEYTVSGTTLTVTGALPVGAKLVIHRVTPLTQEIDWEDGQAVYTPDIEQADDKLTFIAQEFKEQIDRSLRVDAWSSQTPEELMAEIFEVRDDAASSAAAASDSADDAAASAALAQAWAESETPPDASDPDSKSAKTWAGQAESSASDAAASASDAEDSADLAAAWAESPTPPNPNDPTSKSAKSWAEVASDNVPIATTAYPGKVMPDGDTITIDSDGTLHGMSRNPGELVYSMLPIEDASLHLVDGTVLSGSGMYADFVSYVAGLIENQPNSSNVYKVGALQDVDNVLSGFTTSAYAKLPYAFSPGSSPWEMVFKITTGGDVTTQQEVFSNPLNVDSIELYIKNSKFVLSASSNDVSFDIVNIVSGTYTVQTNTTYHVRVKFSGSAYTLEYSLDGTNYVTDITVSSSVSIHNGDYLQIGIGSGGTPSIVQTAPFFGSIDLSSSYISINGSRWWSGTHKAGFMDEAEWQATVSKYKACGCFVYDDVANTLRLPKVTGFLEGTVDPSALGTLVEAGVPGIVGQFSGKTNCTRFANASGAFQGINSGTADVGTSGSTGYTDIKLDASRSSSIYGNSDTVQPQAIRGFVYMVVSNRTKTQIVADIDEIAADLQLKAGVDLGNVTSAGNVRMAHAAMPSSNYVDWSLGLSGTSYTAPSDGYFFYDLSCSPNTWALTRSAVSGLQCMNVYADQYHIKGVLPLQKGETFSFEYLGTIYIVHTFRFVYTNGAI